MDLKNLTTFIAVAELRSFTGAAARLGYTQSTVSTQIRQTVSRSSIRYPLLFFILCDFRIKINMHFSHIIK